jgi:hypothetical protein
MFIRDDSMIEIHSVDLQDPNVYNDVIIKGYTWIRRKPITNFNLQLREPTLGFIAQLYNYKEPYCIDFTSQRGRRLVSRLGFYTNM